MNTCLITGCDMVLTHEPHVFYHGDLHEVGGAYIFVANPNAQPIDRLKPHSKCITMVGLFESRHVYVSMKEDVMLNAQAAEYIGRSR